MHVHTTMYLKVTNFVVTDLLHNLQISHKLRNCIPTNITKSVYNTCTYMYSVHVTAGNGDLANFSTRKVQCTVLCCHNLTSWSISLGKKRQSPSSTCGSLIEVTWPMSPDKGYKYRQSCDECITPRIVKDDIMAIYTKCTCTCICTHEGGSDFPKQGLFQEGKGGGGGGGCWRPPPPPPEIWVAIP